MQNNIKQIITAAGFLAIVGMVGCKKLVEVNSPVTSTSANLVFSSDATAAAVLTAMYTSFNVFNINTIGAGPGSLSFFGGLSADELQLFTGISGTNVLYYTNSLTNANITSGYWESLYQKIFVANSAIEGLSATTSLTPAVKDHLLGEAKFMRAFFYFYLVNLYGDVPLVLSTDYQVNAVMPRTSQSLVWEQITADLNDALNLLSDNYFKADIYTTTTDRLRPTKWAAAALSARANLYQKKWEEAEAAATTVISNTALFDTVSLDNNVFSKTSKEAIWQLQPVNAGWNTEDARLFILPESGPSAAYPVYISNNLLNSFENGDNRKTTWINNVNVSGTTYYYPYKYTSATFNSPVTEYQMVLRLGELYLIRSEARAQKNNSVGAIADLNVIRKRAGLPDYSGPKDQAYLLAAILHERQVELFTEWGHRWLDLKRTGTVDAVMSIVTLQKGGAWNTSSQWYPISKIELQRNPFLQ